MQCTRQVHGVVAAQSVDFCQVACRACEFRIDTDHIQLQEQLIDPGYCAAKRRLPDPASAVCGGDCGACLRVDQLARRHRCGTVPQLRGPFRVVFVKDELDQR